MMISIIIMIIIYDIYICMVQLVQHEQISIRLAYYLPGDRRLGKFPDLPVCKLMQGL